MTLGLRPFLHYFSITHSQGKVLKLPDLSIFLLIKGGTLSVRQKYGKN